MFQEVYLLAGLIFFDFDFRITLKLNSRGILKRQWYLHSQLPSIYR